MQAPGSGRCIYTVRQIGFGALLGGPLAGGYFLSRNYAAIGSSGKSMSVLLWGFIVLVGLYGLGYIMPNNSASAVPAGLAAALYLRYAEKNFPKSQIEVAGAPLTAYSWWRVVGLSVVAFAVSFALAMLLLLLFPNQGSNVVSAHSALDTDGGYVTTDDFPVLIKAIKSTGSDGAFWVVLVPNTAGNDGYAANLQFSVENGAVGLDWVLIAQRNILEKEKFLRIIKEVGQHAEIKEGNGVQYLRVVGYGDMASLGEIVLRRLFGTTSSQRLQLIVTGFEWKRK